MVEVHRNNDDRACGATTTVVGQGFVFVDGQLWAVVGDPNTDGGGGLIPGKIAAIYINGKRVIGKGDDADPDSLCPIDPIHCDPKATSGDANVTAS
jgi:hypothetical protein